MTTTATITPKAAQRIAFKELLDLILDLTRHTPERAGLMDMKACEVIYVDAECIKQAALRIAFALDDEAER